MNRYNPTERIGVNETEKIVIKNLGWIFREQPIVDVGLDAIVEIVENNEPTGKFIAVQIKSGTGNFYKTEKKLSHYVTNIHYNYWLNLSIPIILIAYIPEDGKVYWQEITESNFVRNKKRWKIEIPLKQEFNEKSEKKLSKIASNKKNQKLFDIYNGRADSDDINDIIEDLNSISDATLCINNIIAILDLQTKDTHNKTEQIRILNQNIPSTYSSDISLLYKSLSKTMNLTSKRIETEIEIFSQLYSVGITALEKFLLNLNIPNLKFEGLSILTNLTNQIDYAINEYIDLREILKQMPSTKFIFFKEAINQQIEVFTLFINELQEAREMTKKILGNL